MRRITITAALALALLIPAAAEAGPQEARAANALAIARAEVQVKRTLTWRCQRKLGERRHRTERLEKRTSSMRLIRWTSGVWTKRLEECRKRISFRTLPSTNDWRTAVRIVQRVYPGTEDWLLYISRREGGYGPWVWYGGRTWSGHHIGNDYLGADTVGGWMQFRFSTFAPYWKKARTDVARRGFILPEIPHRGGPARYQAWLDPLGQALTGGYMRATGQDGCHWCL